MFFNKNPFYGANKSQKKLFAPFYFIKFVL